MVAVADSHRRSMGIVVTEQEAWDSYQSWVRLRRALMVPTIIGTWVLVLVSAMTETLWGLPIILVPFVIWVTIGGVFEQRAGRRWDAIFHSETRT